LHENGKCYKAIDMELIAPKANCYILFETGMPADIDNIFGRTDRGSLLPHKKIELDLSISTQTILINRKISGRLNNESERQESGHVETSPVSKQIVINSVTKEEEEQENEDILTYWIKSIGGILAAAGIIWTIAYGLHTISKRNEEILLSKISSLLKTLSSESKYARLAASRGLSKYIDYIVDEVLTAISTEESIVVRDELGNALYRLKNKNMKKVSCSNSETIVERARLFGRLRKMKLREEEIAARLRFTPEILRSIKERHHVFYEHEKKIQDMSIRRHEMIGSGPNTIEKLIREQIDKATMINRLVECTGKVISKWMRDGRKIYWPQEGLDLSETNLHGIRLIRADASHSIFSYCIVRHSNFSESRLHETNFSFSDLFRVCFNNADLSKSNLMCANMRSSSGSFANFSETYLDNAVLSESNYSNATFDKAAGEGVKFRGSKLSRATFNECKLSKCEFQGAILAYTSFNKAEMFRSNFRDADLSHASMINTSLNGSDLSGAKFLNANLQDADFRGAIIENADFTGANIKNAKFEGSKGFSTAIFDNFRDS
jgi:uncharacterized protein YjbI with pentapeptide repeats